MDNEEMSFECRLAAIITLLSSSALRGATVNKAAALQDHLATAVCTNEEITPYLRDALEQTLAGWQRVNCHPHSVSIENYPLTTPGQALH
jgi:hypothetical protein